jgi:hypothetical protein
MKRAFCVQEVRYVGERMKAQEPTGFVDYR